MRGGYHISEKSHVVVLVKLTDIFDRHPWHNIVKAFICVLLLALSLWGAGNALSMVDMNGILVTQADQMAIGWIRENTPKEAKFLISSMPWHANLYIGLDAGYWLPILAQRETTLPPMIYGTGSREYISKVNKLARETTLIGLDPKAVRKVRENGVTHVYIGARVGILDLTDFIDNPNYRLVYSNGRAWIFEIV